MFVFYKYLSCWTCSHLTRGEGEKLTRAPVGFFNQMEKGQTKPSHVSQSIGVG